MDASLRQRLLSSFLYLPIVLLLLWLGPLSFALLLGLVVLLGAWELAGLLDRMGWAAPRFLPLAALAAFALSCLRRWGPAELPLTAAAWGIPLLWLFRPSQPRERRRGAGSWLVHLLGAFYVGLLLSHLARLMPEGEGARGLGTPGARRVLYMLLVTWACDVGAYTVGRLFGRHRLWPAVSPGKTWEGAFGGFAFSVLAAGLLGRFLGDLALFPALFLGGLAGIAGQLGDLVESRLKRLARVKDSGSLIPGHGGMLDRLDSLLLVAPLFYYGLNGWKF
jgi:phosphatidate cytidylyltransferase